MNSVERSIAAAMADCGSIPFKMHSNQPIFTPDEVIACKTHRETFNKQRLRSAAEHPHRAHRRLRHELNIPLEPIHAWSWTCRHTQPLTTNEIVLCFHAAVALPSVWGPYMRATIVFTTVFCVLCSPLRSLHTLTDGDGRRTHTHTHMTRILPQTSQTKTRSKGDYESWPSAGLNLISFLTVLPCKA